MFSSILKILLSILAGLLLSVCLMSGMPWYYFVGFVLVLVITALFLRFPKKSLLYLLLFRAAIDPFLINIRFSVAGVDLGLGGSLSLLLIVGAIMAMLTSKRGAYAAQPIFVMWFIFCLINTLAFFYSFDKGDAAKTLIRYYAVFSLFILSFLYTESEKDVLEIVRAVLYSGALTIMGGFVYYFVHKTPEGRFAATLGHPNILAFYLLILLGCLFAGAGGEIQKWKRWMLYLLFLFAMIFTKTRSGWLAFVIMLFFYAGIFKRKLVIPGAILVALIGFTPFVRDHIQNIFGSHSSGLSVNENSSLGWRLEKWSYLWKAFLEAPFKGHGIEAAVQYGKDALGAHNDYLKFLVETGIFGMIFAFLPYFYILLNALNEVQRKGSSLVRKRLAIFIVIFVPSFLIMSFSENLAAYVVIHWYLWAIIGAYFALGTHSKASFSEPRLL